MPLFVQVIAYNSLNSRKDTDNLNYYLNLLRESGAEIKSITHSLAANAFSGPSVEYLITYDAKEPIKIKVK